MFWARYFFVVGTCPVHRRVFSSIPDLCSLDASPSPLVVTTKYVHRYGQVSPGKIGLVQYHYVRYPELPLGIQTGQRNHHFCIKEIIHFYYSIYLLNAYYLVVF